MPSPHGTNAAYIRGCRCRPCTDAHAAYTREWYWRTGRHNPARPPARHGQRAMYTKYGCRCDPCRAAESEYRRSYRRRRISGTSLNGD